jgi:hypothetical protein
MSPFFALFIGRRQIKDHHLQVVTCQRSNLRGHTELRLLRRRSDERQEDQAEAARQ